MTGTVQYHFNDKGYGIICLDQPQKRNAISLNMIDHFQKGLQQAREDKVRFLVVTGAGDDFFCSGGDLNDFHEELTGEEALTNLHKMKEVLFNLVSFPVPTICLLNGNALGGGCEIATACDFRIAKESSTFGFVQTKIGILPGWGGGTLLYKKVHANFAYQWLLEATIYDALELFDRGWIHKVISAEAWKHKEDLLNPYLTKSYDQMKILKNQYKKSLSVLSLSKEMDNEVRNCAGLWGSVTHKKVIKQFFKRVKE